MPLIIEIGGASLKGSENKLVEYHWKWWSVKPQSTELQLEVKSKEQLDMAVSTLVKLTRWSVKGWSRWSWRSFPIKVFLCSSTQFVPTRHSAFNSNLQIPISQQFCYISLKMINIMMPISVQPYFFSETLWICNHALIQPSGPLPQIFIPKVYLAY